MELGGKYCVYNIGYITNSFFKKLRKMLMMREEDKIGFD